MLDNFLKIIARVLARKVQSMRSRFDINRFMTSALNASPIRETDDLSVEAEASRAMEMEEKEKDGAKGSLRNRSKFTGSNATVRM